MKEKKVRKKFNINRQNMRIMGKKCNYECNK